MCLQACHKLLNWTQRLMQGSGLDTALSCAQKKKDLTAVKGHIVLAEYMEEHPLLLSRPGMGVRLTSYFRKCGPLDAGHQRLAQGTRGLRVLVRAADLYPAPDRCKDFRVQVVSST